MKFTLSWLKEHLDTDEPLEKLADKLTMIGLEVENIEDKTKALAPFSIARVISAGSFTVHASTCKPSAWASRTRSGVRLARFADQIAQPAAFTSRGSECP